MKRALLFLILTSISVSAYAEDSITLWGNYYKERSTRVIEPSVLISKDLPGNVEAEVGYLVDQVTSASGTFTTGLDHPFSEYRNDVRAALHAKIGDITPGISARYSYEPDYGSLTLGADTKLALDRDNTVFRVYLQGQFDDVRKRIAPGTPGEHIDDIDTLHTVFGGVSLTQVLARNVLMGGSLEAQFPRGYQQNPYRANENLPRHRNRFTALAWTAYQFEDTRTTARLEYRFYKDDWGITAHNVGLELTQRFGSSLDVYGQLRFYGQYDCDFANAPRNALYHTTDPKLNAFSSRLYGLGLRWTMSALSNTFLDIFAVSRIEPSYSYLAQGNAYGPAHIAQLGWYWPF